MPRPLAILTLLLTTLLWGFAFVAQKSAMGEMGPFTFTALRYALGAVCLLPLAVWELRRTKWHISRRDGWTIAVLTVSFFLGAWLQQEGLTITTVTNGGFLTSLYVLFVPLLGLVALRRRPHGIVWIGMPLALVGVFLLNGARLDHFNAGHLLVIGGAVFWGVQVLVLGDVSRSTGLPVTLTLACFVVAAALSAIGTAAFETPSLAAMEADWVEIAYAGILSTTVAFTLQAIGQQYLPPSNAAIILSAESLFAALGGAILLGERLPPIGYAGAALIFASIILVEAVPALVERRDQLADATGPT